MDGSHHDWFEGRGGAGAGCLMVLVDDARPGRRTPGSTSAETPAAAFGRSGPAARPAARALYVDRAGIYRSDRAPTAEQSRAGEGPVTQFGRAMREPGVEPIPANSPRAKGRVERMNRTPQDRLVKALRLAGASTTAAANALLDDSFLAEFNERFRVEPAGAADAHRPLAAAAAAAAAGHDGVDLSEVLCEHEERAVGRDWCVQWRGRLLQIGRAHEPLALPGKRVTVREKACGEVQVLWDGPAAVVALGRAAAGAGAGAGEEGRGEQQAMGAAPGPPVEAGRPRRKGFVGYASSALAEGTVLLR